MDIDGKRIELSIAREELLTTLQLCQHLKSIVTPEALDDLEKSWRDKTQILTSDTNEPTTVNGVELECGSALWNLIKSLGNALNKIQSAATFVEALQSLQENSIEVLSLQQQVLVETCVNIVAGYAVRCLIPYEVKGHGLETPVLHPTAIKLYSLEQEQLTEDERITRLEFIASTLRNFLFSSINIFKRCGIKTQNLITFLLHFLYDGPKVKTDSKTAVQLKYFWIHDLFHLLPPEQGFRVLVYHFFHRGCPPLMICAIKGLSDILSVPGNLLRLIQINVSEDSWYGDCTIFPEMMAAVLKESKTTELFSKLSVELKEVICSERSTEVMKGVGLAIAIGISPLNPGLISELIWLHLFGPVSQLILNPVPVIAKLSEVLETLKLYNLLVDLPVLSKVSKFTGFWTNWFGIVAIYAGVSEYLDRRVTENSEFLNDVKLQLGNCIINVISKFAQIQPESLQDAESKKRGKLAEFVISLVIGRKTVVPLEVDLVNSENAENTLDSFQRSTLQDTRTKIVAISRQISRLILKQLDQKIRNILFTQLLQFELHHRSNSTSKRNTPLRFLEDEPVLDVTQHASAQVLVAMAMLSEFGSCDTNLESLLQSFEAGESAFTFLKFVTKKLEMDIGSWANEGNDLSLEFPFSVSLVQTLEIIEVLCETTYTDGKSPKKTKNPGRRGSSSGSSPDDLLKIALQGWENLDKLKPFLNTVINFQHAPLIQSGISAKCEELLVFIETRGRGRAKKNEKINAGHGSKVTVEQAIFGLNSAVPSTVGMGLIELKKLILENDPCVDTHYEIIKSRLLSTLQNDDEYIYNHCINALVALAFEKHGSILSEMLTQFTSIQDDLVTLTASQLKFKLKIGEVLCKTFDSLGHIGIKYMIPVYNASRNVTRIFTHMQLRISAYQVFTALVPHLGYELESIIMSIWTWLECGLNNEEMQVRVGIWTLIESLFKTISEEVGEARWVASNSAHFIKCASLRAKEEPIGETGLEYLARESVRFQSKQLATKLLDSSAIRQHNRIFKIL